MRKGFFETLFPRKRVFLDHAAGTPLAPEARAAMLPWLSRTEANPSSIHAEGEEARVALEGARAELALLIGAHADEILFTGSGTESNNLALFGIAARSGDRKHLVATSFEHHSVLNPARALKERGWDVTFVDPEPDGIVDAKKIGEATRPDTALVSVIAAQNEIGTIQPITEIAKQIRRKRGVGSRYPYFHTDACQFIGTLPFSVLKSGADLVTFNAHKMYGPAGVGALFVKRGIQLTAQILGGGQERGLRSGTENIAAAVGFSEAARIAREKGEQFAERVTPLRDYATDRLVSFPGVRLVGSRDKRLPGHIALLCEGVLAEQLVIELDAKGFATSAGSACSTGENEASYAILALGMSEEEARSTLRITLGRETTKRDIDVLLAALPPLLAKLRRFR